MTVNYQDVLDFWFDDKNIPLQFNGGEEFDNEIRSRFLKTWEKASEGLLVDWRETLNGRLAEVIVLDQFSRNLWRNDIRTYTQDKMAIALAQEALKHPDYPTLDPMKKKFFLLPFMHSESLELHEWANKYFQLLGDENTLYFEELHLEVLRKFGRYPYQNADLNRESTPEELIALKEAAEKGGFYRPKE